MDMQWFYIIGGRTLGPVSSQEIRRLVSLQMLTLESWVKESEVAPWIQLGSVPGLLAPIGRVSRPASKVQIESSDSLSSEKLPIDYSPRRGATKSDNSKFIALGVIGALGSLLMIVVLAGSIQPQSDAGRNGGAAPGQNLSAPSVQPNRDPAYQGGYDLGKGMAARWIATLKDYDSRESNRYAAETAKRRILEGVEEQLRHYENSLERINRSYGPDHPASKRFAGIVDGIREEFSANGVSL